MCVRVCVCVCLFVVGRWRTERNGQSHNMNELPTDSAEFLRRSPYVVIYGASTWEGPLPCQKLTWKSQFVLLSTLNFAKCLTTSHLDANSGERNVQIRNKSAP